MHSGARPQERPQNPLVDIGIPTRGRPRFLVEAVESVLAQTFGSWRLTIGENGPGEPEVADALAPFLTDPRVHHAPSGDPIPRARNHTRLVAAGDAPYVALLHDDDRWGPDFLARRVAFLETHPQSQLVFSGVMNVDERGKELFGSELVLPEGHHPPQEVLRHLLRFNCIGVPSRVVVRRSAYEAVGPTFVEDFLWDDWEMWVRIVSRFGAGYLPLRDVEYRVHASQTTFVEPPDRGETLRFWDHVESLVRAELPGMRIEPGTIARNRSGVLLSMALDRVQAGARRQSVAPVRRALRAYPPSLVDPRLWAWALTVLPGPAAARLLTRLRRVVNEQSMRGRVRLHRR